MTTKVRLVKETVEEALASMDQMLQAGEWYCAQERADALREALQDPEASAEVVVTTNPLGECVAVTRQDDEGRILSVIWESKKKIPLDEAGILAEFYKLYPSDAALVELATNNRDFMLDSIAARHKYRAFTNGIRAAEKLYNVG